MSTSGPITAFPADGLHNPKRLITGHNSQGKSVFLQVDNGDHKGVLVNGVAARNEMYSTAGTPVDLNNNADIDFANIKPAFHNDQGSIVRMIDFAPGVESEFHRSICLAYGTVCEGEMEFSLDGGEKYLMRPGDVAINRAGMHKWRNASATKPARMLFVILGVKPVIVNEKALEFDLGVLAKDYEG